MLQDNPKEILERELHEWEDLLQRRTLEHNQMLKDLNDLNNRITLATKAIERISKALTKLG